MRSYLSNESFIVLNLKLKKKKKRKGKMKNKPNCITPWWDD